MIIKYNKLIYKNILSLTKYIYCAVYLLNINLTLKKEEQIFIK
jgi:hypothetical protein